MEHIPSIIQALPALLESMDENRFATFIILMMFVIAAALFAWIKR